jgi:CelD/BcsL family acetyltransferase involved in cellulose biosynthesis
LLLEELVNWARQGGFAEFDLGIGDEDYKFRWRQTTMELYSAILPRTLRGRAYCNLLEWQTAVKHHLPPGVVQTIKRALGRTKLPTWF